MLKNNLKFTSWKQCSLLAVVQRLPFLLLVLFLREHPNNVREHKTTRKRSSNKILPVRRRLATELKKLTSSYGDIKKFKTKHIPKKRPLVNSKFVVQTRKKRWDVIFTFKIQRTSSEKTNIFINKFTKHKVGQKHNCKVYFSHELTVTSDEVLLLA